jgi:hypothetical protein
MSEAVRAVSTASRDLLSSRRALSVLQVVEAKAVDNRRWAHRRSSATSATMHSPAMSDVITCVVLDTSSTGARAKPHFARANQCRSIKELPASFTLVFTIERVAVECVIVWRRGDEIGLKFVSPSRSVPKPVRKLAPDRSVR